MEENKKPRVALQDAERFPLLTDLSFLRTLQQDAEAPRYNFRSGDRLGAHHLAQVHRYAATLRGNPFPPDGQQPDWMPGFLAWCFRTVPFYGARRGGLADQPTMHRGDLGAAPWQFVSTDCNLDDLLVYQTSGTTGAPLDVLFDPVTQACWIPQLESVLALSGITLRRDPRSVAIALVCAQASTLTYASLSTYLEGAGVLKVNLSPADWHDAGHRLRYLERYNPQVLTGDPFAFLALLELRPALRPEALVSSAMKLTDGIRKELEAYFRCPVLDIYSLTECRMVAFAESGRHRAIRPDLHLEVFDPAADRALPEGERGELVITGGNNPFLPLIRYRTGDSCRLRTENGIPYLLDLEARRPVPFYTAAGKLVNPIDISRAMTDFPLAGFRLHQGADGGLRFTGWSHAAVGEPIRAALVRLFGEDTGIEVQLTPPDTHSPPKPVTYSSDLAPTP
jgi:phenylacetate-CoA ligase